MSLAAFNRLHPNYGLNYVAGVDVSGHQTPQQLADALTWAKWAYIKASEGVTFYDHAETGAHVAVCRERGVPYGFYHFARPERGNDAGAEAGFFATAITRQGGAGALPPVLDIEAGDGALSGWAIGFLTEVEKLTGRRPMLYSYAGFISGRLTHPELARWPLWLAHYANPGADAWCPPPWSDWVAWQYQSLTDEHGHLDVNVARPDFLGSLGAASDDGFTAADRQNLADLRARLT